MNYKKIGLLLTLLCFSNTISTAQNRFSQIKTPSAHPLASVGSYANGCIFGSIPLPDDAGDYQRMRKSRNRHYGHTDLITYVQDLGRMTKSRGYLLLVGDLSQPRGGLMSADHASHQIGLDVDIWLYQMRSEAFRTDYIENLNMRSVVDRRRGVVNQFWFDEYYDLIKDAAQAANVDRIFVNPVIKKSLCARDKHASWLYKIRPWYGHDSHFHVRLKCPANSQDCITQAPVPKVSGCDADLDNWINDQIKATLNPVKTVVKKNKSRRPDYPLKCRQLLVH